MPRLETHIARAQQTMGTHQSQLHEQPTSLTELLAWQAQLEKENQTNPNPPAYVEARMDAGFASSETLTWLLEMDYCPNPKVPNAQTATALCAHLPKNRHWVKVGENAEMLGWGEYHLHGCPYPLTAAVERFKAGRRFKYAVRCYICIIVNTKFRDAPSPKDMPTSPDSSPGSINVGISLFHPFDL